jgi:hypothetical protein
VGSLTSHNAKGLLRDSFTFTDNKKCDLEFRHQRGTNTRMTTGVGCFRNVFLKMKLCLLLKGTESPASKYSTDYWYDSKIGVILTEYIHKLRVLVRGYCNNGRRIIRGIPLFLFIKVYQQVLPLFSKENVRL